MSKKKDIKDKIPGDVISFRTKNSTPQYILDAINRIRRTSGNDGLIEILELGIQAKKLQENQGIFIPLPTGLTSDQIEKVETNDALLTLVGNIIKSSTVLGNEIQFGVVNASPQSQPVPTTENKKEEATTSTAPVEQEEKPKTKKNKRVNLKGKGLTKMKNAFD